MTICYWRPCGCKDFYVFIIHVCGLSLFGLVFCCCLLVVCLFIYFYVCTLQYDFFFGHSPVIMLLLWYMLGPPILSLNKSSPIYSSRSISIHLKLCLWSPNGFKPNINWYIFIIVLFALFWSPPSREGIMGLKQLYSPLCSPSSHFVLCLALIR